MLLDLEVLTESRQTNALPLLLFQVQAHCTEQHRACTNWDDGLLVMVQTVPTDTEKPDILQICTFEGVQKILQFCYPKCCLHLNERTKYRGKNFKILIYVWPWPQMDHLIQGC